MTQEEIDKLEARLTDDVGIQLSPIDEPIEQGHIRAIAYAISRCPTILGDLQILANAVTDQENEIAKRTGGNVI